LQAGHGRILGLDQRQALAFLPKQPGDGLRIESVGLAGSTEPTPSLSMTSMNTRRRLFAMRVLVAGGTGFVGSHVVAACVGGT
jgi:hypothetical protein